LAIIGASLPTEPALQPNALLSGLSEPRSRPLQFIYELFVAVRRISIQPRPRLNQRHVRLCPIGTRITKNPRNTFELDQNLITNAPMEGYLAAIAEWRPPLHVPAYQ
jgi:hypothetical protein